MRQLAAIVAVSLIGLGGVVASFLAGKTEPALVAALATGVASVLLARGAATALRTLFAELRAFAEAVALGELERRPKLSPGGPEGVRVEELLADGLARTQHRFERLGASAARIEDACRTFEAGSRDLGQRLGHCGDHAREGAARSGQVKTNMQAVTAAIGEMGASIQEISRNTHRAAQVATTAVDRARKTNAIVTKLGDSSTEIGNVIKVITSIAEQTNLLALNATIEAARAGDAGKGFAVVANEVKDLATQTSKATEEISQRIEAIQSDTVGAVQAISEISEVISQINDIQQTVAGAVEEQSATVKEINRSVEAASAATGGVAADIVAVADATAEAARSTALVSACASEIASRTADLRVHLGRFASAPASLIARTDTRQRAA